MAKIDNAILSRRMFFAASGLAAKTVMSTGCVSNKKPLVENAAKIKTKEEHQVVVVGAGLGALTAAAYFAKSGFPVTVVEQHSVPGGYATCFERDGGRFNFEVSLHMSSVKDGTTELILRELGLWNQIELVRLPELCRIVTPDFDLTLPQTDPEGCIRALSEHFPDEEPGIRGFITRLVGVSDDTRRLSDSISLADKIFFPFRYPYLSRMLNLTLEDILDRYLSDPRLKSLLSVFWGYYGLPPSRLSGFYYSLGTGQFIKAGGYCYKPRSQVLSGALSQMIEQHGGTFFYNRKVEKIVVENGAVSGVRLKSGERLPARTVVSGASGPATFGKLLARDELPKSYRARIDKFTPSMSSFIVWLGLDRDIRDRIREYEIFLINDYDHERTYRAQKKGDATRADLGVTFFDNAFAGYSTPGTSTATIMFLCGFEPWRRFEADYFAGRKEAYNAQKIRVAKTLVDRVEQAVLPGLSNWIDIMVTASPLTNMRYTGNSDGAVYGYDQTLSNSFNRRLDNSTPVRGLYLAGSWSFPGGGFGGCHSSGRRAFQQFVDDWG